MKNLLLAAALVSTLVGMGQAHAFNNQAAEQACMRYGQASEACQYYQDQQREENRERQERARQDNR